MKAAQQVRTDDRLLLARSLCSWSGSDRQAIEIPNHEPVDFDGFFIVYNVFADTKGGSTANAIILQDEPGLYLHAKS